MTSQIPKCEDCAIGKMMRSLIEINKAVLAAQNQVRQPGRPQKPETLLVLEPIGKPN